MEEQGTPNQESVSTSTDNTTSAELKKADLLKRFLAVFIDGLIAAVFSLVPFFGGLAAAAYMLLRDGLEVDFMYKRSIGKKIMKLKAVTFEGKELTMENSMKRNWTLALGYLTGALTPVLILIPILGWGLLIILAVAALGLSLVECIMVFTNDKASRLGDKMANTIVIETAD